MDHTKTLLGQHCLSSGKLLKKNPTREKKNPKCSLYLLRVQQYTVQGFTEGKVVLYIFDSLKMVFTNLLDLLQKPCILPAL